MTDTPPILSGLSELADDYDAFILDLWGVLHDGVRAYPEAVECMRRLKAGGKTLLVLSNAPRQTVHVARTMERLGLDGDLYHHLMSSGEDTWRHLRDRPNDWYRELGRRMYHLGPERDANMQEGLDVTRVEDIQFAEFLLNTGPVSAKIDLDALEPLLRQAADRELPMVCANPDLVVMRGGERELCAGAVARRYEELDGEVRYHGKPHRGIYDTCFDILGDPDPARVLAVGDTLRTDIAGANAVGIDSVLITGGIHGEELKVHMGETPQPGDLADLYAREAQQPTAAMAAFRW
ncbi:TIGR01459 family HAD-type hydrolase [Ferruginivarius sediminum]|nr:TIGR01459 family HAD-type hydrolase [Ferruginivarius sediminum]